ILGLLVIVVRRKACERWKIGGEAFPGVFTAGQLADAVRGAGLRFSGGNGGASESYCDCGCACNQSLAGEKLHNEILCRVIVNDALILSGLSGFCNKKLRLL